MNGERVNGLIDDVKEFCSNVTLVYGNRLILEVDKENEYIHNSMASIYRQNGEFTSAKIHLKASIDIDENNPITYYNYGNLLVDMANNEEAIIMYEKAIEINPDFLEAKDELAKLQ